MKKLRAYASGAFLVALLGLTGCSASFVPEAEIDLIAHAEQCNDPVIDLVHTPLFKNKQDVEQAVIQAEEKTGADIYVRVFTWRDAVNNYTYLPWIASACSEWTLKDGVTPKENLIVVGIAVGRSFGSTESLNIDPEFYVGERFTPFEDEQFKNILREFANSDLTASTVTPQTIELLNNVPLSLDNPAEYTHFSGEDLINGIFIVIGALIVLGVAGWGGWWLFDTYQFNKRRKARRPEK